ncbi:hypothetical protein [Halocola ammonii]
MRKLLLPIAVAIAGLALLAFGTFSFSANSGELDLQIEKSAFVMPAVHNVYANPEALNGKYHLFKARITNNTGHIIEDVEVNYEIPGFIESTELKDIKRMLPGQSAVVACYPDFDKGITSKTNESLEKVKLSIGWDGNEDALEEEFSFKMTGRNEYVYTSVPTDEVASWGDMFDNDDLLACFVTPNDPVVKYYTQIVQEKVLKGEQATVSNNPKDGVRLLAGIYEATRMAHMVYSGTKGVPQSTDDVQSIVQSVRLPREVITGNTGLCIELSCLYASVLSAAGVDPVIFLVPGHAYPGFRMNGQYYAIEATMISGEGLGGIGSVEQALEKGQKQLQEFIQRMQMGDPRYSLVDIHQLNQQGAIAMDLPDDDFLKAKVDKIAESFSTSPNAQRGGQSQYASNRGGGGGGSSNYSNRTPGPLSMAVPPNWQLSRNPSPQIPIWTMIVNSPDQMANASVYDIPAGSLNEAMMVLQQYFNQMGAQIDYQISGNQVSGLTYQQYGNFVWKGIATQTSGGIRIATVGASQAVYDQYSPQLNQIFRTIK